MLALCEQKSDVYLLICRLFVYKKKLDILYSVGSKLTKRRVELFGMGLLSQQMREE